MSQFVTVDIRQGRLRGKRVISTSNGVTYYSFQGIPYAKPPVGHLRFKPPEDPEPWTGTRDATVEGAVAPQIDFVSKKLVGDENCLFLNVYTPQWPATTPKAVMVWIHGGAFILGSGNTDMYGPDFLVAEDVILVTINYRLGALGFLYMDNANITGNNGLRDQVKALEWVKKNITYFGGDPDNVTIFGESAGACSVHLLMFSSLASRLFRRAIAQNGTALFGAIYTPREVNNRRTLRLAKVLGCNGQDPHEVINFLRSVPAGEIVLRQKEALSEEESNHLLALPFYPSEEVGSTAFLLDSPWALIREGHFSTVPFILGVTLAEGKVMLIEKFLHKKLSEFDRNLENVLPPDLSLKISSGRSKEIADVIKTLCFGKRSLGEDTVVQYIDMMTDLLFLYPLHETARLHSRWFTNTYMYLFDHVSESRINVLNNTQDNLTGVPHGGELPFLFESSYWNVHFPAGSLDARVRTTLTQLWTQFAKNGNPSSNRVDLNWTHIEMCIMTYLKINDGVFSMETDMFKNRMVFLERLFTKVLR